MDTISSKGVLCGDLDPNDAFGAIRSFFTSVEECRADLYRRELESYCMQADENLVMLQNADLSDSQRESLVENLRNLNERIETTVKDGSASGIVLGFGFIAAVAFLAWAL